MTHKDSQGVVIQIGAHVAYNRSGNVCPGEVIDLHPGHIKIRPMDRRSGYYIPKVSKVKHGSSILVLDNQDDFLLRLP